MPIAGSPSAPQLVADLHRPEVRRSRKAPHAPNVKAGVAAAWNL